MDTTLKSNLSRRSTWQRGLYMVLFALIYWVAKVVVAAVVVLQFGFVLISGRTNRQLLDFGHGLSTFVYQVLLFLTFNADDRPFPFSPWPGTQGSSGSLNQVER
jgi:hypothetical protein